MTTATKTLRLRQGLRDQIEQIAKRTRSSFSEVTQDLIDEALRMRKCPGIYFSDEPAGREAKIAGTGLAVWEVVSVYKAVSEDERALRKRFSWLTDAQIKAVLIYYRHYRDEIDTLVVENETLAPEVPEALASGPARRV